MDSTPRTLVVMRHAKAEQFARSDHARRLTERGERDSAAAGQALRALGVTPDAVLLSDAARTIGTWQGVADGGGFASALVESAGLYAAGPETALDLIRETDPSVQSLLVLGHNPTMAYLAQMLDDGDAAPAVVTALAQGFPTSSLAVFRVSGDWADLDVNDARLIAFEVARG